MPAWAAGEPVRCPRTPPPSAVDLEESTIARDRTDQLHTTTQAAADRPAPRPLPPSAGGQAQATMVVMTGLGPSQLAAMISAPGVNCGSFTVAGDGGWLGVIEPAEQLLL